MTRMAREVGCDRMKLLQLRHKLQGRAMAGLDPIPQPDVMVQADQCYTSTPRATLNTGEWRPYCRVPELGRGHVTVDHGAGEWARDDDSDGSSYDHSPFDHEGASNALFAGPGLV
jgi:hypothetical protein